MAGRRLLITQEAFEDRVVTRRWLESWLQRTFNSDEKLDLEINTENGSVVSIAFVSLGDK